MANNEFFDGKVYVHEHDRSLIVKCSMIFILGFLITGFLFY